MNKTEQIILDYLKSHDDCTAKLVSSASGICFASVSVSMKKLHNQGVIHLVARDNLRNRHYSLTPLENPESHDMRTVEQRAKDYIAAHAGCTVADIARFYGMHPRSFPKPLERLHDAGEVHRETDGRRFYYWLSEDYKKSKPARTKASPEESGLQQIIQQAEDLEKKGLWRRAVNVWALALQCKQSDRSERRIRKRRDRAHEQALAKTKYWPGYL